MSAGVLKAFYNSKEWELCREQLIIDRTKASEDKKLHCSMCDKILVDKGDIICHHTPVELNEDNVRDVMVSLNPANLQIVCFACHNKAHGRWSTPKGRHKRVDRGVYIVYGPPLSGKTSYVKCNMHEGDLVVDMDKLYQAMSLKQMYDKPDRLLNNVISARDKIIEDIKFRYGSWRAAWIIGGYPLRAQREKLAYDLGAELILMETSKEECLCRLQGCRDYRADHQDEWREYIEAWFAKYSG